MSAETDHILEVFGIMLAGPTGDGKNKRDAGLKEHWTTDSTHLRKGLGHVEHYIGGVDSDADSGSHPLVHAAWRLLAVAYQDLARAGKAPAPPHPLTETVGQREFWRDVQDGGGVLAIAQRGPHHPDYRFDVV